MRRTLKFGQFLALSVGALASASVASAKSYNLHNAASVYFTPRGQEYFQTHLGGILESKDIHPGERRIPKWEFKAEKPVNLNHLPPQFAAFQGKLREIRELIKEWLIGFTLNNPHFSVSIKDIHYTATFSTLSVRPDYDATIALGEGQGVVFVAEAVVPEFKLECRKIRGFDLNNPFLGFFGVNRPVIQINDPVKPLKIQVPVRVQISPSGHITMEALEVRNNLTAVRFRSSHGALVLPKVQVRVNDKTVTLSTEEIDRQLTRKIPDFVKMAQAHLKDYMETQLPSKLTHLMTDGVSRGYTMENSIVPPGGAGFAGDHFNWGLRPEGISLSSELLELTMAGYAVDPLYPENQQPTSFQKKKPALGAMSLGDYDLAVSMNLKLINRMIKLGFDRGNFSNVDDGSGSALELTTVPFFYMDGRKNHLKLDITVRHYPSGLKEDFALSGPIDIGLQIDARVRMNGRGGFDIVLDHINEDHVELSNDNIRFTSLRGTVIDKIKAHLRGLNAGYRRSEKLLSDGVSIPTDLFGIPIRMKDMAVDNGYLVFYMDLGR